MKTAIKSALFLFFAGLIALNAQIEEHNTENHRSRLPLLDVSRLLAERAVRR